MLDPEPKGEPSLSISFPEPLLQLVHVADQYDRSLWDLPFPLSKFCCVHVVLTNLFHETQQPTLDMAFTIFTEQQLQYNQIAHTVLQTFYFYYESPHL